MPPPARPDNGNRNGKTWANTLVSLFVSLTFSGVECSNNCWNQAGVTLKKFGNSCNYIILHIMSWWKQHGVACSSNFYAFNIFSMEDVLSQLELLGLASCNVTPKDGCKWSTPFFTQDYPGGCGRV